MRGKRGELATASSSRERVVERQRELEPLEVELLEIEDLGDEEMQKAQ
jgi:hypothetical protein